jgi:predicted CopG family antitoxin
MNYKRKLHTIFKEKGAKAKHYMRQCIGMIPEIYRLRIYEDEGFGSIYEYAAKLAGISRLQVDTVLRLEKRFEDKPALKEALVNGEVSHHKLVRIASIATEENQEELAYKVRILPKSALETFVRDEKFQNPDGLFKPGNSPKSLPGQTLDLNEEVTEKLLELQNKGLDVNEILLELLEKREKEIEEEKEQLSQETTSKSRYIPVKIKQNLHKEYGTKCAIPHCTKPAEAIHHTQRYAVAQSHDPRYLAPLCREHHLIAHSIDVNFIKKRQC